MNQQVNETNQAGQVLWRGIDFSGTTVILGVGTGRMIELVAERVQGRRIARVRVNLR